MQQKWWGWGAPDKEYPLDSKPAAWPYMKAKLGISEEVRRPPVDLESIQLPPSRLSPEAIAAIAGVVGEMHHTTQGRDRLLHAYGKSYRDLVRVRAGQIENPPDAVVYPTQEAHVEQILALAAEHGFAVVPFGGGTSVVGGLEMPARLADKPFISLDLARLSEVLAVDPLSLTATVQAGILGPKLEEQLQAQGVTLGHYPQSFEFSTLGGWVATRSAGQQSTRYGKIEQMVQGLRMVTPQGTLEVKPAPARAEGPDLAQAAIGSEGAFGVITEVTVRVHPKPERRDYRAFLFPSWEQGQTALREILQGEHHPATLRLSDAGETEALFKLRESQPSAVGKWVQGLFKWYMRRWREIDPQAACLAILGFEGSHEHVERDRDACQALCERNRGVSLGQAIGDRWYESRFELPYMRDTLMDRGVLVDTLETSTTWANLPALYEAVRSALDGAIRKDGLSPMIFCHISHPYHTGASLYFTFAARQIEGDELGQWTRYKRAATDAIIAAGGALSHHHSVGLDHAPWMAGAVGETGLALIRGLKAASDPDEVLNPGKITG